MLVSNYFKLSLQQPELDFVDIDLDTDLPLFLDPYYIGHRVDPWSLTAAETVRDFFQTAITGIKNGDIHALHFFDYLHEPNETCLGLSQGQPQGRGIGRYNAEGIYNSLLGSNAVKTGIVDDLSDCHIFVEGFGKDRLSDMTTNILRRHLITYTQDQCRLHGIPLTPGVPSGDYWDVGQAAWMTEHTEMLVVNGRRIILVPKCVVSFSTPYTPNRYYDKFILAYLKNEALDLNSVLVKRRLSGTRYVTKKSLKEADPYSRKFLLKFTQNHPDIFRDFRQDSANKLEPISNQDIHTADIKAITAFLIETLRQMPVGAKTASKYHKLIVGIL